MSEPWRIALLAELADVPAASGRLCERVGSRRDDCDQALATHARIQMQSALDMLARAVNRSTGEF